KKKTSIDNLFIEDSKIKGRASSHYSAPNPPLFTGENYAVWSIKMKTFLQGFDLWDVVETDIDPPPLKENPTIAQIKQHSEGKARKYNALAAIHAAVSDMIFTRIMECTTPKEVWDKLKEQFQGSKRTKQIQVPNLKREFEARRDNRECFSSQANRKSS